MVLLYSKRYHKYTPYSLILFMISWTNIFDLLMIFITKYFSNMFIRLLEYSKISTHYALQMRKLSLFEKHILKNWEALQLNLHPPNIILGSAMGH